MDVSLYPFTLLREHSTALLVAFIALIFLAGSSAYLYQKYQSEEIASTIDAYFGEGVNKSVDFTAYNRLGANALPPIMRLGGVANQMSTRDLIKDMKSLFAMNFDNSLMRTLIVFFSIFLGYLSYAMVARIVHDHRRNGEYSLGAKGLNPATLALAFLATFTVVFISSFSLEGFQLILILNFGIFFTFAIPLAAVGEAFGESLYKGFKVLQNNLGDVVKMYILCMGVAIAAPVALLIIFMFPLSVVEPAVVPTVKLMLSFLGVGFALFYQYVVCSRIIFEATGTAGRAPAYMRYASRVN